MLDGQWVGLHSVIYQIFTATELRLGMFACVITLIVSDPTCIVYILLSWCNVVCKYGDTIMVRIKTASKILEGTSNTVCPSDQVAWGFVLFFQIKSLGYRSLYTHRNVILSWNPTMPFFPLTNCIHVLLQTIKVVTL